MFNNFKFHEIPVADEPESNRYEDAIAHRNVRILTGVQLMIWLIWAICRTRQIAFDLLMNIPFIPFSFVETISKYRFWDDLHIDSIFAATVLTFIVFIKTFYYRLPKRWFYTNIALLAMIYFVAIVWPMD